MNMVFSTLFVKIHKDWYGKINVRNKCKRNVSFLPLIDNSITIGLSFLLLSISATESSNTINVLRFLPGLHSSIFP